jgi:hypothetical protein
MPAAAEASSGKARLSPAASADIWSSRGALTSSGSPATTMVSHWSGDWASRAANGDCLRWNRPLHELRVGDAQVGDQQPNSVDTAPVPGGGMLGLAEGGRHLEQVLDLGQQAAPVSELHEHVWVVGMRVPARV